MFSVNAAQFMNPTTNILYEGCERVCVTLPGPVAVREEAEEVVVEVEGRKPGRQRANSSYTEACC